MAELHPLVAIVGPTAVGKTEFSLELAKRLEGEIVSCDSRLFYRGMDIGTAKPTLAERQRVPHHLIDIVDPWETFSLAQFQCAAQAAIAAIHARCRLPLLVGGTGQYIRAVVEGWDVPRVAPNMALRGVLEAWAQEIGFQGIHQRLAALDPQAAANIDARNLRRTIRALEVIFSTGKPFSSQRRRSPASFRLLTVGLNRPRPELYARVDARISKMLADGLVEEVAGLLKKGCDPDLPALSAIGYREIVAHLQGRITLEEAVEQIRRATRLFVRRQANWFKLSDPSICWFEMGIGTVARVESLLRQWLASPASD